MAWSSSIPSSTKSFTCRGVPLEELFIELVGGAVFRITARADPTPFTNFMHLCQMAPLLSAPLALCYRATRSLTRFGEWEAAGPRPVSRARVFAALALPGITWLAIVAGRTESDPRRWPGVVLVVVLGWFLCLLMVIRPNRGCATRDGQQRALAVFLSTSRRTGGPLRRGHGSGLDLHRQVCGGASLGALVQ